MAPKKKFKVVIPEQTVELPAEVLSDSMIEFVDELVLEIAYSPATKKVLKAAVDEQMAKTDFTKEVKAVIARNLERIIGGR